MNDGKTMPLEITVPRLGWTMEEGTFIGWLKKDGEHVRSGEPLFTLDGDKALQEIEATDSGTLRIPPEAPKPGSTVKVGAVLGYLVVETEEVPLSPQNQPQARPEPAPQFASESSDRLKPELQRPPEPQASEAGQASGAGVPPATPGISPANLPSQPALRQAGRLPHYAERRAITPRALRAAAKLNIDWTTIRGTGRGGRIRERDILSLLSK